MLNIAVCDDEKNIVDRIEKLIKSFAAINDIDCNIWKFYDGNELLKSSMRFDLIFLDIEMNASNGIDTACKIRKMDMSVCIVYITGYTDYWRRAYKVHAFDFIPKPFRPEDIYHVLNDFLIKAGETDIKNVKFKTDKGEVIENSNKIYYFIIKEKKTVQACTAYREFIIKENLSDIFAKLDQEQFYMSHKSCIVNLKYVESIQKNDGIIMKNGVWLPLAQKKQKDFYYRLSKQLRDVGY